MGDTKAINQDPRITYLGVGKPCTEWLSIMGYKPDEVLTWFDGQGFDRKQFTMKLIRYNFEGAECTLAIRNQRRPKNLVGMKFGRLRVFKQERADCYCLCECGNETIVKRRRLIDNYTKSCGCLRKEHWNAYVNGQIHGQPAKRRLLAFNGKTLTVTEWSRQPEVIEKGIKRRQIYTRLNSGWSIERTLTEPNHYLHRTDCTD